MKYQNHLNGKFQNKIEKKKTFFEKDVKIITIIWL